MKEKKAKEPRKETVAQEAMRKYQESLNRQKAACKAEPNKWKRFWKYVWLIIKWPFQWIWMSMHDWGTIVIFVISMLLIGCEVWFPYLMGLITWGSEASAWWFGIGSACWLFWLAPGTPFLVLCIGLTVLIKSIRDRIKNKLRAKKEEPVIETDAEAKEDNV